MNIGDLFFAGHLDAGPLKVDAMKAGEAAGTSFSGAFGAKVKGSSLLKGGFAAGLGIGAAGFATSAIAGIGGALNAATEAFLKDEESQARLGASLKANIPRWDQTTTAIERTVKARMALGFTDEDQRDSLARLVAATHDVNQALEIQSTAMDLARFKGISLAEASDALIKVEAGSYRILKSLGIVLKDGATQEEALTAVRRVAQGQAESYANTITGKLLVAQVELGEAQEQLGRASAPLEAFTTSLQINLVRGLERAAEAAMSFGHEFANLTDTITPWDSATERAADHTQQLGDVVEGAVFQVERAAENMAASTVPAFDDTGAAATNMSRAIAAAGVTSAVAIENMRKRIVAAATGVIDGAYNTISAADQLSGTNAEIAAQRRIIAAGGAVEATNRGTSAIDRQVKALERASEAEKKRTDAQLAAIDVQIDQLDLAEKQLSIEERRHSLNEQLNEAQLELIKAQGGTDAQAISDAMDKITDIKEQQAEDERQLGVEAKRDALETQRDEIRSKADARQTELNNLKTKLREQEVAVSASTGATVADARVKLHELFKTQADLVLTLALAGKAGSKEVSDALVDMRTRLTTAVGEERTAILATIKALKDLQGQAERTLFTVPGVGSFLRPVGAGGGPQATDSGASGAAGVRGQPVIVRLEIGGQKLIDYLDDRLAYRHNR